MKGPTCEYCGRCLSVCPSYKHHLVETFGPRARIDLARAAASGELTPGETANVVLPCWKYKDIVIEKGLITKEQTL